MSGLAVELNGASVTYETRGGPVHAMRDVTLEVRPGETVGVAGESGSGKSTLAKALLGLTPLSSGTAHVLGEPVRYLKSGSSALVEQARRIQMVFQDSYTSLNPRLSPVSTVAEAARVCQGLGRREATEHALELLSAVGFASMHTRAAMATLSGGQRQRVSIARALAADPRVLVADEPTSSLDQSIAASLLNLLRRIQRERGLSIIFITHDLGIVEYLADRVFIMKDGSVVETGPTAAIFERPETDYTRRLIDAMPRLGATR
jgi:ATPase components of various ABC-type transport systems, contain duplicated ATPase